MTKKEAMKILNKAIVNLEHSEEMADNEIGASLRAVRDYVEDSTPGRAP